MPGENAGCRERTAPFVSHNMAAITSLCSYAPSIQRGKTVSHGDVSVTQKYFAKLCKRASKAMVSLLKCVRVRYVTCGSFWMSISSLQVSK